MNKKRSSQQFLESIVASCQLNTQRCRVVVGLESIKGVEHENKAMTTTVHRQSLDFTASLEQAYKDLQSIHDCLDRQDGDILQIVERIHSVETRVAHLVTTLDGTVGDLRAVKQGKMKLLSSILDENAALAARLGTKRTGAPQR